MLFTANLQRLRRFQEKSEGLLTWFKARTKVWYLVTVMMKQAIDLIWRSIGIPMG